MLQLLWVYTAATVLHAWAGAKVQVCRKAKLTYGCILLDSLSSCRMLQTYVLQTGNKK